jgi:hypothetical protein
MLTILDGSKGEVVVGDGRGADIDELNVRVTEYLIGIGIVWYAVKFADLSSGGFMNV